MDEFEIDDIVRFKLGGPLMLVIKAYDTGTWCIWFTSSGEYQQEQMSNSWLMKVEKIEAIHEIKNVNEQFDLIMLKKEDE